MVRRLKSDIHDAEGNPVFPKRILKILEVEYTQEEQDIYELLRVYTESRTKTLKETKSKFAYGSEFIHILLKKRLFSSPMAFALTLEKHRKTLLHGKKKQENTVMDEKILRNAIIKAEEEFANDAAAEEAQNEAVEAAGNLAPPLTDEQIEMLDKLSSWVEKAKNRVDSKANAVLAWLDEYLKTNGKWNNKRVILFTEYRATHSWLHQILASHGYGGEQLMFIHGEMTNDDRETVKAAFQAGPDDSKARILLATDAASEGIDLQNHCNYLLHIEIPWNPNVLEQRNGRIDRHGQKESEVFIWHPASKGVLEESKNQRIDIDHRYLWRAVQKVNTIREDIGSVGDVIAKQIVNAMIGERKVLESSSAEERAAFARKFIAGEKRLKERIANLHEKLMESKSDFRLSPEHIAQTVKITLELAEKPAFTPIDFCGCPEGKVFEAPPLPGVWGKALAGLEHPHTHKKRPVTFDHEIAKGRDDIVLLHLNHKLVQMCLRLLREELWSLGDVKHLNRVTVYGVPDSELGELAVAIWSRLVISGGDNRKLHEELTLSGGELKYNGFARIPQLGKLKALIDIARPFDPNSSLFDILKTRFTSNTNQIEKAYMARSNERLQDLNNTLLRQKEKRN
jgi:hypothetical protein